MDEIKQKCINWLMENCKEELEDNDFVGLFTKVFGYCESPKYKRYGNWSPSTADDLLEEIGYDANRFYDSTLYRVVGKPLAPTRWSDQLRYNIADSRGFVTFKYAGQSGNRLDQGGSHCYFFDEDEAADFAEKFDAKMKAKNYSLEMNYAPSKVNGRDLHVEKGGKLVKIHTDCGDCWKAI